jgi:bacteriorhodopsin
MECIPYFCGIGGLGLLTLYQVNLARKFMGNFMDKLYFYYAHLITCIPIVLYIYKILDTLVSNIPLSLNVFYLEWVFTTPMIIMNISRLIQISVSQYIFITICDLSMILCGYVSYISESTITIFVSYSIGCFLYILLFCIFLYNLNSSFVKVNTLPRTNHVDSFSHKVARTLIALIAFLWIFYPITHILYKTNNIDTYTTSCVYIGLDVLTKGIFTNLLLGSREIYSDTKSQSWVGSFAKRIFKVYPMSSDDHMLEMRQLEDGNSCISCYCVK